MIYLTLFLEFFKTGILAVGGGLATIPFLMDMAQKYDWLTTETLADMIAVGESTPGPIGINCATYAGYNAAGIPGALVATFALVLPSFIIILLISKALMKYQENRLVKSVFSTLRPGATGLIAAAGWSVAELAIFDFSKLDTQGFFACVGIVPLALFVVLMVLTNIKPLKNLHPLVFIGVSAVAGIALSM